MRQVRQVRKDRHVLKQLAVACLLFSRAGVLDAQNAPVQVQAPTGAVTYLVFLQQRPVGREEVLVVNDADGWTVRGSSQLGPPIDIVTRRAEIRYDSAWNARSAIVEGVARGQDLQLRTTFANGSATSEISAQGKIGAEDRHRHRRHHRPPEHVPRLVRDPGAQAPGAPGQRGAQGLHRAADRSPHPRGQHRRRAHGNAARGNRGPTLRAEGGQPAAGRRVGRDDSGPTSRDSSCG